MKKILVLTLIAAFVLTATLGLAANKSAFFTRKVPGGPVLVSNETLTTGDIWFVDSGSSGAGTTSAYGQSPDSPCSTLEACVNNSTGSQGDWIVVMSGHAETLTSATELVLDKADIRIMGLGEGRAMPAFTVDNTAASINVDAANVTLENLFFDFTATDSVDDPFDINAADFSMVDCEIVFADSTGQADKLFTLDANADRFLLLRTTIRGGANAGATDAITAAGTTPEGLYIIDSSIEGDFDNAAVYGTAAITDIVFLRSHFENHQDGDHAIELSGNALGYMEDCTVTTNAIGTALDPGTLELFDVTWYDNDHPANAVGSNVFAEAVSGFGLAGIQLDTSYIADASLPADPTSDSMAAFIASGGTALGTELPDSMSIVDLLGAFTGGVGDAAQDDNVKASLDLLNTDTAIIVADTPFIADLSLPVDPTANSLAAFIASGGTALGTELADSRSVVDAIGHTGTAFSATTGLGYWMEKTVSNSVDEVTANIWDIAGGGILVKSFFGIVTVLIGANVTTCTIQIDPDDGSANNELSTAVAIETDVLGTKYVFSNANPSVLTPLTSGAAGGGSILMSPWIVREGMLSQVMSADPGGAVGDHIMWYMTYVPLVTGVTVTAQ